VWLITLGAGMNSDVEMANDEGADPNADSKKQNPGATTAADQVAADDPQKVEKLAGTDRAKDPEEEGA
jgi:hypothetical protein